MTLAKATAWKWITVTSAEASAGLPGGCIQAVPPAGAARETRWVLTTAALVLAASAWVVGWQRHGQAPAALQTHQIDLATGLSAAEQGIYTDLQAVHDEWQVLGAPLPPPTPDNWATGGWPPFADDLAARQRGALRWALRQAGQDYAYVSQPANAMPAAPTASANAASMPGPSAATPRAMLWRLLAAARSGPNSPPPLDVWLRATSAAPGQPELPGALDDASLTRHGWQQITAHLHARYGRAGPVHHHHHHHAH